MLDGELSRRNPTLDHAQPVVLSVKAGPAAYGRLTLPRARVGDRARSHTSSAVSPVTSLPSLTLPPRIADGRWMPAGDHLGAKARTKPTVEAKRRLVARFHAPGDREPVPARRTGSLARSSRSGRSRRSGRSPARRRSSTARASEPLHRCRRRTAETYPTGAPLRRAISTMTSGRCDTSA